MKKILLVTSLVLPLSILAQQHSLEKIWETDTVIAVPESVLPDIKKDRLYISLIDGGGWVTDGKGGVGILSPDNKSYNASWITGLNAPKGMGIIGNKLYVADMNEVVVIDIKKGRIDKKIALEGAAGLNDITVTGKGILYVSDSRTGNIWKLENESPSIFLDSMKGVNGLKAIGNDLYIGAGKNFLKSDENGNLVKLAELPQGIDGIEPVGNGDFILTSWAGYVFYVSSNGTSELLLDTHLEKKNTADIGYDETNRILYIPTFNGKTVVAYRLK